MSPHYSAPRLASEAAKRSLSNIPCKQRINQLHHQPFDLTSRLFAGGQVQVRCGNCGTLNSENAKFCSNCGQTLAPAPAPAGAVVACPSCGTQNAATAKFCANCGTSLQAPAALTCPKCGTESPPGTRFCPNCGTNLEEPSAAPPSTPPPSQPPS